MSSNDEGQLLNSYVGVKSEDAFRRLVDRYFGLVLGTALRHASNRALAEDIVQIVFAILARKAGTINPGCVAAWLHRTTIHQSRAAMRTEFRHRRKLEALAAETSECPQNSGEQPPSDDVLRALDEAIDQLSEVDRKVLMLRFFEGWTYPQIARGLGRSEAAIQRRGHRALDRLRGILQRRGAAVSPAAFATTVRALSVPFSSDAISQVAQSAWAASPQLSRLTLLRHAWRSLAAPKKAAAVVLGMSTAVAVPVTIHLSSGNNPKILITSTPPPEAKHPPRLFPAAPPSGFRASAPVKNGRLGRGKERYSIEEAQLMSERIVEQLELKDSRAVTEWMMRLPEFFTEGFLDPDDWSEIERLTQTKRRPQVAAETRASIKAKAISVYLERAGRDRGGPIAFAAYHLERLEMLPSEGTKEDLAVYDWVRTKACVDRGVLEGRSPSDVPVIESLASSYRGELPWNSALVRLYAGQGDWPKALAAAEEAVAMRTLSQPGRPFDEAAREFRHEMDEGGRANESAYFTSPHDFSDSYVPLTAATELFRHGLSLPPEDAPMTDRCWRASLGLLKLAQSVDDLGARNEAIALEKRFVTDFPPQFVQSFYGLPAAEVVTEIDRWFARSRELGNLLQPARESGDAIKIEALEKTIDAEGMTLEPGQPGREERR